MYKLLDTINTLLTVGGIAFLWWVFFFGGWSRIVDHFLGPQPAEVKTGECDDGDPHDFDDWSDPIETDSGPKIQHRKCWHCNLVQERNITDV